VASIAKSPGTKVEEPAAPPDPDKDLVHVRSGNFYKASETVE